MRVTTLAMIFSYYVCSHMFCCCLVCFLFVLIWIFLCYYFGLKSDQGVWFFVLFLFFPICLPAQNVHGLDRKWGGCLGIDFIAYKLSFRAWVPLWELTFRGSGAICSIPVQGKAFKTTRVLHTEAREWLKSRHLVRNAPRSTWGRSISLFSMAFEVRVGPWLRLISTQNLHRLTAKN